MLNPLTARTTADRRAASTMDNGGCVSVRKRRGPNATSGPLVSRMAGNSVRGVRRTLSPGTLPPPWLLLLPQTRSEKLQSEWRKTHTKTPMTPAGTTVRTRRASTKNASETDTTRRSKVASAARTGHRSLSRSAFGVAFCHRKNCGKNSRRQHHRSPRVSSQCADLQWQYGALIRRPPWMVSIRRMLQGQKQR